VADEIPVNDDQRFSHGTNRDRCFCCGRGQDWDDEHDDHDQCEGGACKCPCRPPLTGEERYVLRAMLAAVRS
jgi:hypothetical protein